MSIPIALTGKNSLLDYGLWIILILLVALVLWVQYRPKNNLSLPMNTYLYHYKNFIVRCFETDG